MINPTRISVDDATRRVLDSLSEQLTGLPLWVGPLKNELEDMVRDTTRYVLTGTAKSLHRLEDCAASQGDMLVALRVAFDQLGSLLHEQGAESKGVEERLRHLVDNSDLVRESADRQERLLDALRLCADGGIQQLATLSGDLRTLDGSLHRHQDFLADVKGDLEAARNDAAEIAARQDKSIGMLQSGIGEIVQKGAATAQHFAALSDGVRKLDTEAQHHHVLLAETKHGVKAARVEAAHRAAQHNQAIGALERRIEEALRHAARQQEEHASKLDQTLQAVQTCLTDLHAAQASQHDALQLIEQRMKQLGRPWWKRIF